MFTQLVFRPNVVCELNSNDIALRMVADGAGAALIPLGYARTAEGVRSFHLEEPLVRQDVLAFRKGAERTGALEFLAQQIASDARFRSGDET